MDMPQELWAPNGDAVRQWDALASRPADLFWSTRFLSRRLADYALHQMTPQELRDDGGRPC